MTTSRGALGIAVGRRGVVGGAMGRLGIGMVCICGAPLRSPGDGEGNGALLGLVVGGWSSEVIESTR